VRTTDRGAPASVPMQGRVVLDAGVLKQLRNSRQLSQEELANECANRHFRVSISSIKRAETGKPVLFRIARELARFYDVPADRLIGVNASAATSDAISLADEPLNLKDPGGPITGDYDLNRLKGQLLKLLGLPEKSILYLLETAELARNDSQRCEAWCELTDAYLSANRRGEAQEALRLAERYAASSGPSRERLAHIVSLRRMLGAADSSAR
jgi:transcriptional regulator with XRE-family HTH domain